MSIERILEKLESIEKKLEALEELKPLIFDLCGKCVNDLLYLTHQEIQNKKSAAQTSTSVNEVDDDETNPNEIEKGQEPEKEVIDKNIDEPKEMDTSSLSDVTSQIDEEAIVVEEEENTNEEEVEPFVVEEDDDESVVVEEEENANEESYFQMLPGTSFPYHRARHSNKMSKELRDIVRRLANCIKKDSGNTLLHVIEALNAKLYLDKARRSRRNLDQLPTFDDMGNPSFSLESSPSASTSMLNACTSSSADAVENVQTAEEVFAIYPKFDDDENNDAVEDTPVQDTPDKKPFKFEPFADDFLDRKVNFNFDFKDKDGEKK